MNICCKLIFKELKIFLNQARTGCKPAHTWFLEIAFVHKVGVRMWICVYVCFHPQAVKNYSREMKPE